MAEYGIEFNGGQIITLPYSSEIDVTSEEDRIWYVKCKVPNNTTGHVFTLVKTKAATESSHGSLGIAYKADNTFRVAGSTSVANTRSAVSAPVTDFDAIYHVFLVKRNDLDIYVYKDGDANIWSFDDGNGTTSDIYNAGWDVYVGAESDLTEACADGTIIYEVGTGTIPTVDEAYLGQIADGSKTFSELCTTPIRHYQFNEGSGLTVFDAVEAPATTKAGTLSGFVGDDSQWILVGGDGLGEYEYIPPTDTATLKYALQFDGIDDYVTIPTWVPVDNAESEVKIDVTIDITNPGIQYLIGNEFVFKFALEDEYVGVIHASDWSTPGTLFTTVDSGRYELRARLSGGTFSFYVDDVLIDSDTRSASGTEIVKYIGYRSTSPHQFLQPGNLVHSVELLDLTSPPNSRYYFFNEGSGLTAYNATEVPPAVFYGKSDDSQWLDLGGGEYALEFDGANDRVRVPDWTPADTGEWAVEVEIDIVTLATGQFILGYEDQTGSLRSFKLYVGGADPRLGVLHDSDWTVEGALQHSSVITGLHTVRVEFTGGTLSLSVDGQVSDSKTTTSVPGPHVASFGEKLGALVDSPLASTLHSVKLLDFTNASNSRHYLLNEGTGIILEDSWHTTHQDVDLIGFSNNTDGIIYGAPVWVGSPPDDQALVFDGIDDYIGIPDLALSSDFDIEIDAEIVAMDSAFVGSNSLSAEGSNAYFRIGVNSSGNIQVWNGDQNIVSSGTYASGERVTIKYSVRGWTSGLSGTTELFVDSVSQGTAQFRPDAFLNDTVMLLGAVSNDLTVTITAWKLFRFHFNDLASPNNSVHYLLNDGHGSTVIQDSLNSGYNTQWVLTEGGGTTLISVPANVEALTLTALNSVILKSTNVDAVLAGITLQPYTAVPKINKTIAALLNAIELDTHSATIQKDTSVVSVAEVIQVTSYLATILKSKEVSTQLESVELTTHSADVTIGSILNSNVEAIEVTTNVADILHSTKIDSTQEQLSLTTNPVEVTVTTGLTGNTEAIDLTTYSATFPKTVAAIEESIELATNSAGIQLGNALNANTAILEITTPSAQVYVSSSVDAVVEHISLTGFSSQLTLDTGISANIQTITLDQNNATIILDRDITSALETISFNVFKASISNSFELQFPGLEYTIEDNKFHFTVDINRLSFTFGD